MLLSSFVAHSNSDDPVTLPPGALRTTAAAGGLMMNHNWTWCTEASIRAGLPFGLEIATPLALAIRIVETKKHSGLVLAAGITDFRLTPDGRFVWTPAVVMAAQLRVASSASARFAFDLTGLEEGFASNSHPGWIRGNLALLIDVGPYLTIAAGFAVQRIAYGKSTSNDGRRPGWVSDSRLSFGAVRSQPFNDLPTIAIHPNKWIDIIVLMRTDLDSDSDTTDFRILGGIRMNVFTLLK